MAFHSPRRRERPSIRLLVGRSRRPTTDDRPAASVAPSQPTSDRLHDRRDLPDRRGSPARNLTADRVLLAYLPDNTPVYGVLDTDRTPLYVWVETPAWSASATAAGHLSLALRVGDQTVELELTVATRWHLRTFLSRNTLDHLLVYANLWEHLGKWCAEGADEVSGCG